MSFVVLLRHDTEFVRYHVTAMCQHLGLILRSMQLVLCCSMPVDVCVLVGGSVASSQSWRSSNPHSGCVFQSVCQWLEAADPHVWQCHDCVCVCVSQSVWQWLEAADSHVWRWCHCNASTTCRVSQSRHIVSILSLCLIMHSQPPTFLSWDSFVVQ